MKSRALILVGLIVLVTLGIIIRSRVNDKEPHPTSRSASLIISDNAIYVAEQAPGPNLKVAVVRLERPGFVIIRETSGDKPGPILGASDLLPAGETENLPPISLSRATIDGETIDAIIYLDNGDGKFEPATDQPALDSVSGEMVTMVVTVSQDASEPGAVSL